MFPNFIAGENRTKCHSIGKHFCISTAADALCISFKSGLLVGKQLCHFLRCGFNVLPGLFGINTKVRLGNIQSIQSGTDGVIVGIEATAKEVTQLFSDKQTIVTDIGTLKSNTDGLSDQVKDLADNSKSMGKSLDDLYQQTLLTNAYIKSGLLYYKEDGTPVYGLEIGQTNSVDGQNVFDKFARFASDRLSFFDSNDVEVAYISDYKLYITNAEITGSLWLSGKFKIYYNGGLAFQWIGGDS